MKQEVKEPVEFDAEDFPRCPYCWKHDQDWWDGQPHRYDGDSWESTCGSCGKDYTVTMCVSYSFDTKAKEPPREKVGDK